MNTCYRSFAIPADASLGNQALRTSARIDHIEGERPAMVASVVPVPFKIIT
jgi:hypothetical protein